MWFRRISKALADGAHHVRVAEIEADSDIVEVRAADQFHQAFRSGKLVGNVLQQDANPSGLAKARRCSIEVMAASNFFSLKLSFGGAQMLDQEAKRNLLGDFQRALDFVHGFDAAGAVGRCDVDGRRAGASPLVVGVQRRVHRVQRNAAGRETSRQSP